MRIQICISHRSDSSLETDSPTLTGAPRQDEKQLSATQRGRAVVRALVDLYMWRRKYGATLELCQWTEAEAALRPKSAALMEGLVLGSFVGLDIARHLLRQRMLSSRGSGKRHGGGERAGTWVFTLPVWTHILAYWVMGTTRPYGGQVAVMRALLSIDSIRRDLVATWEGLK